MIWSGIIALEGEEHALSDGRFIKLGGLTWPVGPIPLVDESGQVIGETLSISRIGNAILAELELSDAVTVGEIFPNVKIADVVIEHNGTVYDDDNPVPLVDGSVDLPGAWSMSGSLAEIFTLSEDEERSSNASLKPLRKADPDAVRRIMSQSERHVPASELDDANTDAIAAAMLESSEFEGFTVVEGVKAGDNRVDLDNLKFGDEFNANGTTYRVNDLGTVIDVRPVPDDFSDWHDVDAFQQQCKSTMAGAADAMWYCALGLGNEAGELQGKIKKLYRDDDGKLTPERQEMLIGELGDVMWYLAMVASHAGIPLSTAMAANVEKLKSRKARGVIKGDGDVR